MSEELTDTSTNFLVPENHYEAVIKKAVRKDVKGFILYEWQFKAIVDGKDFNFKIGLFASQCADILRAIGAKEVSKNKFKWNTDDVENTVLSFNLAHAEDKKGIIREVLSDIKLVGSLKKDEVAW